MNYINVGDTIIFHNDAGFMSNLVSEREGLPLHSSITIIEIEPDNSWGDVNCTVQSEYGTHRVRMDDKNGDYRKYYKIINQGYEIY